MHHDPVTLVVTLDANGSAKGQLYLDDERTFAYKVSNRYTLVKMECSVDGMESILVDNGYASTVWVERIEIYGFGALYKVPISVLRVFKALSAVVSAESATEEEGMEMGVSSYQKLDFSYDANVDQLIVRKPAAMMRAQWKLHKFEQASLMFIYVTIQLMALFVSERLTLRF